MPPEERDAAYLWDMLQHAKLAVELAHGTTFHAYIQDRFKQLALERALEIVGEAAGRLSREFRCSHPEIPWRKIISHRNVLAHEYDEILQELLWKTATEAAPGLVAALEKLIPRVPRHEDP